MKKRGRIKWTPEMEARLADLYQDMENREIARVMKLPVNGITARAFKLGLRKADRFVYDYVRKRLWTDDKVEELKRLYPTTPATAISRLLHISPPAVRRMAKELGLEKEQPKEAYIAPPPPKVVQEWSDDDCCRYCASYSKTNSRRGWCMRTHKTVARNDTCGFHRPDRKKHYIKTAEL